MRTKVIEISYMTNGVNGNGDRCRSIESQVQDIFDENDNYRYVDLIYKPQGSSVNMRYATLIVDTL